MKSIQESLATDGYISLRQFSALIGVSYPTARAMQARGEIRGVPVGKRVRIYADEVQRFQDEGNYKGVIP